MKRLLPIVAILTWGLLGATALAQAWTSVPGARGLARPGAAPVTLEVRRRPGHGSLCGGGGCSAGVEVRNVRGRLPSPEMSHYFSDRPGQEPGCFGAARDEALFADWTEVVIARARGGEAERPSCGMAMDAGDQRQHWVILRVRPVAP